MNLAFLHPCPICISIGIASYFGYKFIKKKNAKKE